MLPLLLHQPAQAPATSRAVETWGWSLLVLFLVLLAGAMVVLIVKRVALGGRAVSSRANKKRRTDTRSAWEEAGRRMPTPDSDLKEEP